MNPLFSLLVLCKSRLCARPFGKKRLDFHQIFLRLSDGEEMRLVRNVECIDQKVGLEYLVLPTVFLSGEFGATQSRASPLGIRTTYGAEFQTEKGRWS